MGLKPGPGDWTTAMPLVLSNAAVLSPVATFPSGIRERLGGADDDFVLSRQRARAGSQRINAETAEFLRRFERPSTIVEATIAHARHRGLDPDDLLDEVFELVLRLRDQRILVSPTELVESVEATRFHADEDVFGFRIDRCLHRLADTEVYRVVSPAGNQLALKYVLAEAPPYVKDALLSEARLLRLAGESEGVMAHLHAWDLDRPDPYLVMDWFEGPTLDAIAAAGGLGPARRASMARGLAEAYRAIHRLGILHGDVHPGNVIVGASEQIHLVDFGAASTAGAPRERRLGLVAHYEPEVAVAALAGYPIPPATAAGEQYAIAALLYLVLTGAPPIALALETARSLGQIASEPPRPFREFGATGASTEPILMRALAKRPDDRFPSFEEFTDNVLGALDEDEVLRGRVVSRSRGRRSFRRLPDLAATTAAARLHRAYGLRSGLIHRGLADGPRASIYHGAAGLSLAFLRLAVTRADPEALAAARVWLARAQREGSASEAFSSRRLGISIHDTGPGSILHGPAGLHLVTSLVSDALGDQASAEAGLTAYLNHAEISMGPWSSDLFGDDLANGSAGLLLGLTALKVVAEASRSQRARWLACGRACSNAVATRLGEPHGAPGATEYLGMAHGTAGRAYALLRWCEVSGDALPVDASSALAEMLELRQANGGRAQWPIRSVGGGTPWSGWCHGSAGYVLLWSLAADVLGDHIYGELALMAAEDVWASRDGSAPSLCCGLAGQAIAVADLGRRTGLAVWMDRGRLLASAASRAGSRHDNPGLFKGAAGPLLAVLETAAATPQFPILGA